ncbi:glycosyltransferase [Sulfolobus islandicus]|uniref:Glycosyl transferase, group 1 n=2 Tax=Saccharolobus islandicus TaxID=43080 RepID=F0NNE3_SACI0|nr:glycosyl transferase, group 1 [Sulfolobus islandicus HVE10/4]WCM36747.1 glycosyltransferase [Sulfolobus islandicus]
MIFEEIILRKGRSKMKIGIFEPFPLNFSMTGGGGVVLQNILAILKKRGYSVHLFSPFIDKVTSSLLSNLTDKIISLHFKKLNSDLAIFGITRLYSVLLYFLHKFFDYSYDYTICSTYDNLIGSFDFGYVHFPSRKYFKLNDIKNVRNVKDLVNFITSVKLGENTRMIAVNSSFTLRLLKEKINRSADVLYPPVKLIECDSIDEKDDIVVSLGRIVRDKNYDLVINIAKKFPRLKFIIIGRVQDSQYYNELLSKSPSNVIFLTNASEDDKRKILCKAKVILHAKVKEPFGISVVEGMSTGAVPVVHKSGGSWIDIIEEGKYGYGYLTEEEAVESLYQALNNESLRKEVKERAKLFNTINFEEKFLKITNL